MLFVLRQYCINFFVELSSRLSGRLHCLANAFGGTGQIGDLGLGILDMVISNGGFDGILSKHGAMHYMMLV